MEFETFSQLLDTFRPTCLCGSPLTISFQHSIHMDDDYTVIKPIASYQLIGKNEYVLFPMYLESRSSPYCEINFSLRVDFYTSDIILLAKHVNPTTKRASTFSPEQLVKYYFSVNAQHGLRIYFNLICSEPQQCLHAYCLTTDLISFNLEKMKLNSISLKGEAFNIMNESKAIKFRTDYKSKSTSIIYHTPSPSFVIGTEESIKIESEKFVRYPFNKEFLLNKVKTLLLFS